MIITSEQFEEILLLACEWAEANEGTILLEGNPLTIQELNDARAAGVAFPENVRLLAVEKVAIPQHPMLKKAAEVTGLISPSTGGMTLRYGIWVRADCWNNRALVAHELVHVHQYERMGGFEPFLRQYLWECLTDGYPGGAMEQEAVLGAAKVMQQA